MDFKHYDTTIVHCSQALRTILGKQYQREINFKHCDNTIICSSQALRTIQASPVKNCLREYYRREIRHLFVAPKHCEQFKQALKNYLRE